MKIKRPILNSFLDKINMSEQIMECVLDFGADGLHMVSNTVDKLSRVNGFLKASAFTEYEAIGSIGIDNLTELKKLVKRFGENISIKVEGNQLTLSETGKKVDMSLMDKQFIATDKLTDPILNFADSFSFPADKLNEIISDSELSKDSHLIFKTEPQLLKIQNTGKYKFLHEFAQPNCKGGVAVRFGQPLVLAVKNFTDILEFNVSTNYPIKIIEKTENTEISVIVAPLVVNKEDE